ncbi:MAG: NusG domain II-containing protein [Clostridiales bacterium]|nr:NusG domain II-containing protein [Clostridiales bacterium]
MDAKIEKIRTSKFPFKLWDLPLYAALLAAAVFLAVSVARPKGETLEITYYDKQNTRRAVQVDLNKDDEFDLFVKYEVFGEGRLLVVIKGGEAWVEASECHNQICVHMGKISRVGQQIVCSPYRVFFAVGELKFGDAVI